MNKDEQKKWIKDNIIVGKKENITAQKFIYILTEIIDKSLYTPLILNNLSDKTNDSAYNKIIGIDSQGHVAIIGSKITQETFNSLVGSVKNAEASLKEAHRGISDLYVELEAVRASGKNTETSLKEAHKAISDLYVQVEGLRQQIAKK